MNNILDLSVLDDFFVFLCECETLLKSELVWFWPQMREIGAHTNTMILKLSLAVFGREWPLPCAFGHPLFSCWFSSPPQESVLDFSCLELQKANAFHRAHSSL